MAAINDNFANRIVLNGSSISVTGSNVDATGETGEPNHAQVSSPLNSLWWSWTAPTSGEVTINTFGSDYDTTLGVYTGSALNNLFSVASNDDTTIDGNVVDTPSRVTFNAVAGQTYQIAVDGYSGNTGAIALNLGLSQIGTSGNNILNGTSASDTIRGGGGDDQINGNGGYDFLFGEGGNDQISGGSLTDYIDGGAGNDTIYGNGGEDYITGGNGNDTIYGSSQSEFIDAGAGNDIIYGNGGADYIETDSGVDTVWLGAGQATVVLTTDDGFDTINNFQLDQTRLQLGSGLNYADLSFTDSANGTSISYANDLLAVVSWTQASTFINNPDIFV